MEAIQVQQLLKLLDWILFVLIILKQNKHWEYRKYSYYLASTLFGQFKRKKKKSIWVPMRPRLEPCESPSYESWWPKVCSGGQLWFLVHLSQHLMHHAEQRTAQAQQLIQEHIVMWVAPDVGPHSCDRLTHTSKQPSWQHTHSPTSTPRPAQASPKQGNQGTWGLDLDAACGGADPGVQCWGFDVALVFLQKPGWKKEENEK